MTQQLKQKLTNIKIDYAKRFYVDKSYLDGYLKAYLLNLWHIVDREIDHTQSLLILLRNGSLKRGHYIKEKNMFTFSDGSMAFPQDVVKFMYLNDLYFE